MASFDGKLGCRTVQLLARTDASMYVPQAGRWSSCTTERRLFCCWGIARSRGPVSGFVFVVLFIGWYENTSWRSLRWAGWSWLFVSSAANLSDGGSLRVDSWMYVCIVFHMTLLLHWTMTPIILANSTKLAKVKYWSSRIYWNGIHG